MSVPMVSVITPVYNCEKELPRCLKSLKNQTFHSFEAIFINDGSSDGSKKLLEEAGANDSRFYLINQENMGAAAARLNGIAHARGAYVCFVDADDFIEPTMIEYMYQSAVSKNADLVMCGYRMVFPNKCSPSKVKLEYKMIQNDPLKIYIECVASVPAQWNKLYRREIIKKANLPESIRFGEDMVFCTAIAPYVNTAVILPDFLYNYVIRKESITQKRIVYKDEKNAIDHFINDIVPNSAYETSSDEWRVILATRAFISVIYSNLTYGQAPLYFQKQIKKLRAWKHFDLLCSSIASDKSLCPIRKVGGVSFSFSIVMRVVFLLCMLHMDKVSSLILFMCCQGLEVVKTIRFIQNKI